MATVGIRPFELYRGDEGDMGNIFQYGEKASQTFKKGDWVKLDTAGRVEIGVDTESGIWGLALADASGTTDALVDILVINPNMYFSASQSNAGAAQATTLTMKGLRCSWIKSTESGETAKTVIDTADTTTPDLEIVDLDPRDAIGDTNGRLVVRVIAARLVADAV